MGKGHWEMVKGHWGGLEWQWAEGKQGETLRGSEVGTAQGHPGVEWSWRMSTWRGDSWGGHKPWYSRAPGTGYNVSLLVPESRRGLESLA